MSRFWGIEHSNLLQSANSKTYINNFQYRFEAIYDILD